MTAPARVGPSPSGGGPAALQDPDELLADIGDRIRAERRARGWSQTTFGQICGMSLKRVHLVETGRTSLPLLRLSDICRGLQIPMSDLLSEEWEMPAGGDTRRRSVADALSFRQVLVLREAASGIPLGQVADRLGMQRGVVSSRLSEAYRVLGVEGLPRGERRAAAVRVAEGRGLLDPAVVLNAA